MSTQLSILSQESVGRENFILNGENKDLHLVVKNLPFSVQVGATGLDLRKCNLQARLFYDMREANNLDSGLREVETLKAAPLDFICHVDPSGASVNFELKIGVLSSAHEGSFFRIVLTATDNYSGVAAECQTAPIKVMSKKSQVIRRVEKKMMIKSEASEPMTKKRRLHALLEDSRAFGQSDDVPFASLFHDDSSLLSNINQLKDIMLRVEGQQMLQNKTLQKMMQLQQQQPAASPQCHTSSPPPLSPNNNVGEQGNNTQSANTLDFDQCLAQLIASYQSLPQQSRKRKLQQAFDHLKPDSHTALSDIVREYSSEGHFKVCPDNCIYKQQLDQLETFCTEIMRDPLTGDAHPLIIPSSSQQTTTQQPFLFNPPSSSHNNVVSS